MTGDRHPLDSSRNFDKRLDLDFALQAAGLGVWQVDPVTNQGVWDDRCRELFGLDKDNCLSYEQAIQYIHPDDIDRVNRAVQWAIDPASEGIYDCTFRTIGADDKKPRWVRFFGRADFSSTGGAYRFAGLAQEVTQQTEAQQRLEENQREVLNLFEESPVGIATISADDNLTFRSANPFYGELVGRQPAALVDKPLLEALPELVGQGFDNLLREVIATGVPFIAKEVAVDLVRNNQLETIYVDLTYQPRQEASGPVFGILVVATNVTQQVRSRQQVEASETKLRGIVAAAPAGIGLFVGRDLVIENPNQTFIDIVGKGPGVEGLPLREAMPELLTEGQPFLKILDDVFTTGVPFTSPASLVRIVQNGVLNDNYYNISYTPVYDNTGQVYAILDIAIDVTEQVKAQQALADNEAHLQLLRNTVPAMIFYLDAEQRYQSYNETFMRWFNVDAIEVVGKTVREFVGEAAYQAVLPHLTIAYGGQPEQYELFAPSRMGEERWLSITYTPHQVRTGEVLGLIVHAADITQNKQTQAALQEREAALQNAIELAEIGSYSIDVATQRISKSARTAEWYGLPQLTDVTTSFSAVEESDRERIRQVLEDALRPGSGGAYQVEYSVLNQQTGHRRILRTNGQVQWDSTGQPLRVDGTLIDVTSQRELQLALEQEVQQRTEELASANKELAATNEEYAAINQELQEANSLLARSNDNLQKFAYVASHDLQEPLRKIQQFGDLLRKQYGPHLGEGSDYLERMQTAASRMSTLIRDLLSFSRISVQRDTSKPVSLNQIVDNVLITLELVITETEAQVEVEALPTVLGDDSQLTQLFQNLLSNALKFHRPGVEPAINVRAQLVLADNLPSFIKPARSAQQYHRIDVADNGIGFDEKYLDRIFDVFQRLHSKSEFAGTGIGLAICEKVVANHGGAITATSQPGQGATFSVYLPAC